MSTLYIKDKTQVQEAVEDLYRNLQRRIASSMHDICPIDITSTFIKMSHAQSCGKCVPCRVGLGHLSSLMDDVLDGRADMNTFYIIEDTASAISNSADCAIGYEAANMVLKSIKTFKDDYKEHIIKRRCLSNEHKAVPCVSMCPANVDVPAYISLIREGRFDDAVKIIKKDNPFPSACSLICEHPCEENCRRNIIDDAVNIRGLKKFAVENAGDVPILKKQDKTDKKIAIIGAGPSGLTCAYYLSLMGHDVTVFEKNDKLGGMLRYGIPSYRLPRKNLDNEINAILSTGIKIEKNKEFGKNISIDDIKEKFDAMYIAIGAHSDKKLKIEGEDANGVISAVEMLKKIGDEEYPDFKGKKIVVVGGGNVAMDVSRTSVRLGADVICAYRRRVEDMTALKEEIEGAVAEGVEIMPLISPISIKKYENNDIKSIIFKKQIVGTIKDGKTSVRDAKCDNIEIDCDFLIVAIGQDIQSEKFQEEGIPVKKNLIDAFLDTKIENIAWIFSGGDCVSGPKTVIKAIEAGKVAASNIDKYLGYDHVIDFDIEIPHAYTEDKNPCSRINMTQREAKQRKNDMLIMEHCMSKEEAMQESSRCLRCDKFGYGRFRGGRVYQW